MRFETFYDASVKLRVKDLYVKLLISLIVFVATMSISCSPFGHRQ